MQGGDIMCTSCRMPRILQHVQREYGGPGESDMAMQIIEVAIPPLSFVINHLWVLQPWSFHVRVVPTIAHWVADGMALP